MKRFSKFNHRLIMNILFMIFTIKLIIDINLIKWFSDQLGLYKGLLILNLCLSILFNIKYIPILKNTSLAALHIDDIFKKIVKFILTFDTLILTILLLKSYLLSIYLFYNNTGYFLGIFALFSIIYFGIKSFKECI